MTHKTIVITGASDGIGAAAARRLSRGGENVVVVGRSESKTTAVAAELGADYFVADFADLSQVRALADKIRSEYPRIDVLINNAGLMVHQVHATPDGYEATYQVNFLAPFLLTTQLLDRLVDSRATIVNTTSSSHRLVRASSAADLENTSVRRPSIAYAYSKLAIVLFTKELHRRYHADGLSVATVHPGYVNSNFGPASESRAMAFMDRYTPVSRFIASSTREPTSWSGWPRASQVSTGSPVSITRGTRSRKPIARPTIPASPPSCGIARWPRSALSRQRRSRAPR